MKWILGRLCFYENNILCIFLCFQICKNCTGCFDRHIPCVSMNCPVLFKLSRVNRELSKAPYLRQLLDQFWLVSFTELQVLFFQCLPLNCCAWCFSTFIKSRLSSSVFPPRIMKTLMLSWKLYLLISELLTSYSVQIPHSVTFVTLSSNAGVGFAPVCVTSCRSIWVDHVYFPVEGALKTS